MTTISPNPNVQDLPKFYNLSALVDIIRDVSRDFTISKDAAPAADTLNSMVEDYNQLRLDIAAVLSPEAGENLLERTGTLDDQSITAASIYYAAAKLSRFMDALNTTESFLMAQEITFLTHFGQRQTLRDASPELIRKYQAAEVARSAASAVITPSTGQYL